MGSSRRRSAGIIAWVGGKTGKNIVHNFVYYTKSQNIEGDIGIVIPLYKSAFDIIPMFGAIANPAGGVVYYLPQAYWFSSAGKHYSELWYVYYYDPHCSEDFSWTLFQERYEVLPGIRVGPQLEWFYDYKNHETTQTLLGGGFRTNYGKNAIFDVALTRDVETHVNTGRMTFIFTL